MALWENILLKYEQILNEVIALGFSKTSISTKTIRLDNGSKFIYLKIKTGKNPLVIHSDNENNFSLLSNIAGVETASPMEYYHNSTMRGFEERINEGKDPTKYGIAFGFEDNIALRRFISALCNLENHSLISDFDKLNNTGLSFTERYNFQKARIGQGQFRNSLIEEFQTTCPLTQISRPELLMASHIKPWSKSDNYERLDPNNGILLAVHFDKLFDAGLISFNKDGKILIAPTLSKLETASFNIDPQLKLSRITTARSNYIDYHRECIFNK